jgi:hypothetical protein
MEWKAEWISVEDKLPEPQIGKKNKDIESVLAYSPSTIGLIIAIYFGDNLEGATKGWTNMGVTHWMPKPPLPTE